MIRFFTTILSFGTLVKNRTGKIYRFLLSKTGIIRLYYVTPLALCSDRVKFSGNTEAKRTCEGNERKKQEGTKYEPKASEKHKVTKVYCIPGLGFPPQSNSAFIKSNIRSDNSSGNPDITI